MKRLFTFLAVFTAFSVLAQTNPVTWSTSVEKGDGNQAWLVMTATIESGWHLYSQHIPEGGPIPTTFVFEGSKNYTLKGNVAEGEPHEEYDPNFEMTLKYYSNRADFLQEIEVNSTKSFKIKGELEFMVCNDQMCMPPEYVDIDFEVDGVDLAEDAVEADMPVETAAQEINNPSNPVTWSTAVEYTEQGQYFLVINAAIEPGWHLYSQNVPEGGPIATSFVFDTTDAYSFVGKVTESEGHEAEDPVFEMMLKSFDDEATFKQEISVKDQADFKIKGELEFMVCNDQMCMPPTYVDIDFDLSKAVKVESAPAQTASSSQTNMSLWGIFFEGFTFGWLALFMPCIFPMIPLTVSFFTKQSKTKAEGIRKAGIYGLSIIGIYVSLGLAVSIIFGADALNQMATNPIFNYAFFALFVVFAISFFGAFEITLPSKWVNKADEASNKGGLIGIFFMAFTLSLVSFACTGPLIGTLLVDAVSKGDFFGPATGMFGFAFALAIPFALFAAFPGWLNSMPKSGGWLNNIKVVLGFLELAFAFMFFSTADLVMQTHILEREMFIAIWVGIAFLIALYLLGVFIMPLDSKVERTSIPKLLFAMVFTIFGFYMLPGIWGAPVKLISGFPPPEHYAEVKGGSFANHGSAAPASTSTEATPEHAGGHCPFDLNCFNDFDEGMAYAKKVGKPVMIDFTGWGCVNCRKMEESVWSDPRVLNRLRNDVVLISLYVDERTKLPKDKQYISEKTGRKIKNIGNKWSEFQEVNFGAVAQPYYIFLNHQNLTPLIEPAAYDPDVDKFIDWMDRGKHAFEQSK